MGEAELEGRLVERLRIDAYAHELVPIGSVLIGEDGSIWISQPQDFVVRIFDAEGTPHGALGSRGAGPGEFSSVQSMGWMADTLWVWDSELSRMTFVSPDGELVRSEMVSRGLREAPEALSEIADAVLLFPMTVRPDGRMYASMATPMGWTFPAPYAHQLLVGLTALDGTFVRILAQVPHGGQTGFSSSAGGGGVPFPNRAFAAGSRDGGRIAGASTSLQGVEADSFSLTVWDSSGAVAFSRLYPFEPVPLPRAVVDSAYAARAEALPPGLAEAFLRDVETPPVHPPLTRLFFGNDESIWVEEVVRDGARPYLVIGPNGDPVGRLILPEETRIAAADLEQVWTLERDPFDVESVVRYDIVWGDPAENH